MNIRVRALIIPPCSSLVCDMKEDCDNGADENQCGSCSFETDMCGWRNKGSSLIYKYLEELGANIDVQVGLTTTG